MRQDVVERAELGAERRDVADAERDVAEAEGAPPRLARRDLARREVDADERGAGSPERHRQEVPPLGAAELEDPRRRRRRGGVSEETPDRREAGRVSLGDRVAPVREVVVGARPSGPRPRGRRGAFVRPVAHAPILPQGPSPPGRVPVTLRR